MWFISRFFADERKLNRLEKAVQQEQRDPSFSLVNPQNLCDGY